MTEWWQVSYPIGKPVPSPGFPRELHPPDAPGKNNQPGPDVLAYKRAMSRGGRWPWAPDEWDPIYSNNFAHGKIGGKVETTGISGFQRQMNLKATGVMDRETFEKLRVAKIPKALPNAGQPLLDANALNLLATAWKQFKGHEPVPPKPKPDSHRLLALEKALTQVGVRESPYGSNRQKYGEWYGINGEPWCAIFVTYCFETTGNSGSFRRGSEYSYVPNIVYDAIYHRNGLSLTSNPIPGDLVCYDWHGGGADHVGIFRSGTPSAFKAVEGNTSGQSNSNGGQVQLRDRSVNRAHRIWFVRVDE